MHEVGRGRPAGQLLSQCRLREPIHVTIFPEDTMWVAWCHLNLIQPEEFRNNSSIGTGQVHDCPEQKRQLLHIDCNQYLKTIWLVSYSTIILLTENTVLCLARGSLSSNKMKIYRIPSMWPYCCLGAASILCDCMCIMFVPSSHHDIIAPSGGTKWMTSVALDPWLAHQMQRHQSKATTINLAACSGIT
jgi:hypothetical protein